MHATQADRRDVAGPGRVADACAVGGGHRIVRRSAGFLRRRPSSARLPHPGSAMRTTPIVLAAAAILAAAPLAAQDAALPDGWVRVAVSAASDTGVSLVRMPPGWHITSSARGLVFHPAHRVDGNYTVEVEVFVFPSTREDALGVFVGGAGEAGATAPSRYVAFLLRRDGAVSAEAREGADARTLAAWTPAADAAVPGDSPAKNVIRIEVGAVEAVMTVNGGAALTVPREGGAMDGAFGFVVGEGANLHVSRLDVTHHLAPPAGVAP